ncbi:hypothetical protein GCM10009795_021710 [Nocardioides hankookensis]|uniref:SRPBCC family protein n=1 Tax=Nocardioides hankookensis TaxID=443157 RepID=A0ABW1LFI5_9ACTN
MSTRFPVTCEVAFDYLVDPRNRPAWQSSLKRVDEVDGAPRVGQTWVDVTRPGLRPRMETTELERPHRWTERGTWRGYAATLTLTFTEVADGCDVDAEVVITGPFVSLLRQVAPRAVRRDLRHAASMLSP